MRPLLRTIARLGAACLTVAASLPGQLELVHQHAGGEQIHVHADAERLAAHDRLEDHHHPHDTGHSHAKAHTDADHTHRHAARTTSDGPDLWAVGTFHVHGLNPLHQATCGMVSCDTSCTAVACANVTVESAPRAGVHLAARPRGPPTNPVG